MIPTSNYREVSDDVELKTLFAAGSMLRKCSELLKTDVVTKR